MPAVPKPRHNRRVPKRWQRTKITRRVRQEVLERSGGACERCGRTQAYAFECAHLINASQLGSGREPWNVVLLCGPKVNTGTCHQWVDETREGREWKQRKREELKQLYNPDDWG
jgi:hypothetical protein